MIVDPPPRANREIPPTQVQVDDLLDWLRAGKTLTSYYELPGAVSARVVKRWRDQDPALDAAVRRARTDGLLARLDEAIDIADRPLPTERITVSPGGVTTVTEDNVLRSRLMVDARVKSLPLMDPAHFGGRVTVAGDRDAPIQITQAERVDRVRALLGLRRN